MRRAAALAIVAALTATAAPAAERSAGERLSEQIFKDPARMSARLLSRATGHFTEGWLGSGGAYFFPKPAPVVNVADLCGAEGLFIRFDNDLKPTTFSTLRVYRAIGGRALGPAIAKPVNCAALSGTSGFFWAPSGPQAARAVDLFNAGVTAAAGSGALSFELTCEQTAPACAPGARALLAGFATWRIQKVEPASPCAPEFECFKVELWLGDADNHEAWSMILSGDTELRSARLEGNWHWIVDP